MRRLVDHRKDYIIVRSRTAKAFTGQVNYVESKLSANIDQRHSTVSLTCNLLRRTYSLGKG